MTLVLPAAGRRAIAGGNEITLKIGPESGARDISVFTSRVAPGGGVFPHLHLQYEEAFYVVEGEVTFLLGTAWEAGPAGTVVHVPTRTVHAFQNRSARPAELLVMHTPAAAVRMIEELALPATASRDAFFEILANHSSQPAAPPPKLG